MGEKRKCDYCGRWFDIEIFQTLDNGCDACPECVSQEERDEEEE